MPIPVTKLAFAVVQPWDDSDWPEMEAWASERFPGWRERNERLEIWPVIWSLFFETDTPITAEAIAKMFPCDDRYQISTSTDYPSDKHWVGFRIRLWPWEKAPEIDGIGRPLIVSEGQRAPMVPTPERLVKYLDRTR